MTADKMITVYNMGNFKTGKTSQTHSKVVVKSYEEAGYKLISCVMMRLVDYLKGSKR